MKSQPLLVRVPVVIFAVLVGGIYVYARSGGRLFTTPAKVTPAAEPDPHEVPIGLMMGSKSAPAFLPEERTSTPPNPGVPQPTPPTAGEPSNRPMLLPGSKSAAVVVGEYKPDPPPAIPPQPTNIAPVPSNRPHLLPGSKSVILADPPNFNQPQQQAVQLAPPSQQPNRQPAPRRGVER
jgi:hypothetical protein